jgi:hypothetical protein
MSLICAINGHPYYKLVVLYMIPVKLSSCARPTDKITDDVQEFSLQLKQSLLAEFENVDAITTEDETFVHYHVQHFWSRFGYGQTGYTYRCNHCQ